MSYSNQIDNNESLNSVINLLNETLSSNNLLYSDRSQSPASILDSGISSSGSTSVKYTSDEKVEKSIERIASSLLFERIIRRCNSMMKVRRLPNLEEAIKRLLMSDDELETWWQKLWDVYWHGRHCHNSERIENEMYQCFNALINDDKGIMIGLDSESSLKDLLITSMRICSEPNFTLEIRIGLGGTKNSLNLRAPSYGIACLHVLEQLFKLREKFPPNQPDLGVNIPTKMLINPPILTFFCAWTAAVNVNRLDTNTARKNAHDLLQYIQWYIEHSHANLSNYVRYELDHENSCEERLLGRIIRHYNSRYDAKHRGSDEEGSIRYASMHLIMAKDIMDKNAPRSISHLLGANENDVQNNRIICLYDCIITIGGSIEEKFNQVRYTVRQSFIKESVINNENNYHFPLSIRILSKAGQIPVYYRDEKYDITVDDVKEGRITSSQLTDNKCKPIVEDLSILKEDVGRNLLKPLWNRIPNTESNKTSSWRNIILNLADLFIKVWEVHAKNDNRTCQCLIQNQTAFEQVCAHYNLSDVLDTNTCLIIEIILGALGDAINLSFGQTVEHLDRRWKRQVSNSDIFRKLDDLLGSILIDLVRNKFS